MEGFRASLRAVLTGSLLCAGIGAGSVFVDSPPASATSVANTIGVVSSPSRVCSDGSDVWVANYTGSNTVTELDARTGLVVNTIEVGSWPWDVSSDGTHVWVTNSGSDTVTQ
jgi:YVTN family beta-propeller protein